MWRSSLAFLPLLVLASGAPDRLARTRSYLGEAEQATTARRSLTRPLISSNSNTSCGVTQPPPPRSPPPPLRPAFLEAPSLALRFGSDFTAQRRSTSAPRAKPAPLDSAADQVRRICSHTFTSSITSVPYARCPQLYTRRPRRRLSDATTVEETLLTFQETPVPGNRATNGGGRRGLVMGRRGGAKSLSSSSCSSLEFLPDRRDVEQTQEQQQESLQQQQHRQRQQQRQRQRQRKTPSSKCKTPAFAAAASSSLPSSSPSAAKKNPPATQQLLGRCGSTNGSGSTGSSNSSSVGRGGRRDRRRVGERPAVPAGYGEVDEEVTRKMRRPRGVPLVVVCDAESITHPELLDCINIIERQGERDVGMIYKDWKADPNWRSYMYQRSKADRFSTVQKDPLSVGADPLGDDTMTVDIMGMAHSDLYRKHDFCLISSDDSMSDLAIRLRKEGRRVTGVGRRQAPPSFLQHCDAFIYIDPANRYELLMDEGLVMSVALCIALAAFGQEKCEWVRMKTIISSLHSWDLGLESPNYYGYTGYDEIIDVMDVYLQGVEDTSGEIVLKVPPKPTSQEVPRGLEEVAQYLYHKWVWFTKDSQMNDILLACIPTCVHAVATARNEVKAAVNNFRRRRKGCASPS